MSACERRWIVGEEDAGDRLDVALDGFNCVITLEAALSGGLVLIGRDGCLRDLSSIHGTYRAVSETPRAVELLGELAERNVPVLTVEDHHTIGGFGSCVVEACNERGIDTRRIHRLGLPDSWIYQGSRGEQQAEAGIDADGIVRHVTTILEAGRSGVRRLRVG